MKNILDFIFEKPKEYADKDVLERALAHYCEQCDTAFKTVQGKASHVAIRHIKYGK